MGAHYDVRDNVILGNGNIINANMLGKLVKLFNCYTIVASRELVRVMHED